MIRSRIYIVMFVCSVLAICSIAAYYYVMEDLPKKMPVRAKQVWVMPQNNAQGY